MLIKDGETVEDAMHRQGYYNKRKAKDDKRANYKLLRQKEDELSEKLSKIYQEGDKGNIEKYNLAIRELTEKRKENYQKLTEAIKKEVERINSINIDKLTYDELEKLKQDAQEIGHESGIPYDYRKDLMDKIFNINQTIKRTIVKAQADKVGGYTKKLNDLCGFTQFSDLSSYPMDLQKHIYDNYKIVYDKYPQIKYGGIKIERLKDNVYAQNLSYSNIVTINSKKYNDLAALKKSYDYTVKMNFHPQGTDYNSIIVHELGHGLQQYIEKKYKITAPEIRARVLKNIGIKQKDVGVYLSKYAMTKPREAHEFYAEAFAEYMTSKSPRPLAIEFGKEINRILNQK